MKTKMMEALVLVVACMAMVSCGIRISSSSAMSTTVGKHKITIKFSSGAGGPKTTITHHEEGRATIKYGPSVVEVNGSLLTVNGVKYDIPNDDDAIEVEDDTVRIGGVIAKPRKALNPKDPQQVAEGFWRAVIAGNYEEAETYVLPGDRESFRTEAVKELKALPPLPDQPKIKARTSGDTGSAVIENWTHDDGPEMVLQDGRWWITR